MFSTRDSHMGFLLMGILSFVGVGRGHRHHIPSCMSTLMQLMHARCVGVCVLRTLVVVYNYYDVSISQYRLIMLIVIGVVVMVLALAIIIVVIIIGVIVLALSMILIRHRNIMCIHNWRQRTTGGIYVY